MSREHAEHHDQGSEQFVSRRYLLSWIGTVSFSGVAGCSGLNDQGDQAETPPTSVPSDSVFENISFAGPNLVVNLIEDHGVDQLELINPDGSTFERAAISEGSTRVEIQIVFKTGGTYPAGDYELVAIDGESTESMTLELRPEIQIVDVEPEFDKDDGHSSGRLFVTVENIGTGPSWVYNIGFRNAPYRNAPEVIEGNGVADTTFERPAPGEEFLSPGTERIFLKRRGILVIDDNDKVSCEEDTAELTVVVQTPHGDIQQPIRAQLSGGYHVDDQGAIQHPCKDVRVELLSGGGENA